VVAAPPPARESRCFARALWCAFHHIVPLSSRGTRRGWRRAP
jgi:hypothetical protein